jgi:signal peptidase I
VLPTDHQGSATYLFGGPKRGDVVVFHHPTEPGRDLIKRIIGLPGDAVSIRNGQVFVNAQLLNEPYVRFAATYAFPITGGTIPVPENAYFVLGDNRPVSLDSHLGWFVPADNLVGPIWVSWWPPGLYS